MSDHSKKMERERDDALDRLVRLLRWTEKEQEKAWNQWVKKLPNKDAPKSHFLIARSETMREVARKIKREMRGLSLPNDPAMASAATMEPENQQTPKNDE
jgi:thioesterase domain-containing protein